MAYNRLVPYDFRLHHCRFLFFFFKDGSSFLSFLSFLIMCSTLVYQQTKHVWWRSNHTNRACAYTQIHALHETRRSKWKDKAQTLAKTTPAKTVQKQMRPCDGNAYQKHKTLKCRREARNDRNCIGALETVSRPQVRKMFGKQLANLFMCTIQYSNFVLIKSYLEESLLLIIMFLVQLERRRFSFFS